GRGNYHEETKSTKKRLLLLLRALRFFVVSNSRCHTISLHDIAQRQTARVNCAVCCQNAVKVVYFVLEQFRKVSARLDHSLGAVFIYVVDIHFDVTADADHQAWKGETIVPQFHHLAAGPDDLRIHHRHSFADFDHNNATMHADLRSSNSATISVALSKIAERRRQVRNHFLRFARLDITDRGGRTP